MTVVFTDGFAFGEYTGMVFAEPVLSGGYLFVPFLAGDKDHIKRRAAEHAHTLKERISELSRP